MYIASFKSITNAIKAKNILIKYSISAEIIKLDPSFSEKGCAYGVKIQHYNLTQIYTIFQQQKIKYVQIKKIWYI